MFTGTLHPYQDEAADKFLARGNLLAAMGTGTGKTITTIAVVEELLGCGDIDCALLIVPAGLRYQWAEAIAQFTDIPTRKKKFKSESIVIPQEPYAFVIDGLPPKRDKQYAAITDATDYVIVGYETVLNDTSLLEAFGFPFVALDEATAIKTPGVQTTECIKALFAPEYRIALTATAIENRPEELFSIMQWVDDRVLGRWDYFDKTFVDRRGNGTVRAYVNLPVLWKRVEPAMYRKTRWDADVAPFFPQIDEEDWFIDMDPVTREVYYEMGRDLLDELEAMQGRNLDVGSLYTGGRPDEGTKVGKIMAMHQAMQMLLDHPIVVVNSALNYDNQDTDKGSKYCSQVYRSGLLDDLLAEPSPGSPKLDYLTTEVLNILDQDPEHHKVLIYTRWRDMVTLIEDRFNDMGLESAIYHGGLSNVGKTAAKAKFNSARVPLFISSHAGAYGQDMYMASHLIKVDQPWSGGAAEQIDGRHDRVSNDFENIYIRNMIMAGTIEERMLDTVEFKRSISAAVMDGKINRFGELPNDVMSLTRFLSATIPL